MATKKTFKRSVREIALAYGFRSGLEKKIADNLTSKGVGFAFEKTVIPYMTPATPHKYTPDFILENGVIVESKGRFLPADRKKHLLVKAQHPEHDIRFVFSNSNTKISKGSKTSYADWCAKNGYLFADKDIPEAWINEEKK